MKKLKIAEGKYVLQGHRVVMLFFEFRSLVSSNTGFFTIVLYCATVSIPCNKETNMAMKPDMYFCLFLYLFVK